MTNENSSNISLEQKVLASATGIFAGLGTIWLIGENPHNYSNVRDSVFNIGVPTLAYVGAAASLYLTNLFSKNK